MLSRAVRMSPDLQKSWSVYVEKVAAYRELLEAYEIGKRIDSQGSIAASARMVGLQVVDNRPK